MKTRKFVWIAVLMMALFVLAACQQATSNIPADPVEAVKLIADKQQDIKSEHLDVSLTLGVQVDGLSTSTDQSVASMAALFKNFKATANLNGDVDNAKNDFQLKGTADLGPFTAFLSQGASTLAFDLVKVGDTMYSRMADQPFNKTDVKASGTVTPSQNSQFNAAQLSALLKKTAKADKLSDETIDGADSYHYKVNLNIVDLLTEAAQMAQASGNNAAIDQSQMDQVKTLLKDSTADVEIWVGKADLFIRQEKVHLNFNLKDIPNQPGVTGLIDVLVSVNLTKVNQPVTITAPN